MTGLGVGFSLWAGQGGGPRLIGVKKKIICLAEPTEVGAPIRPGLVLPLYNLIISALGEPIIACIEIWAKYLLSFQPIVLWEDTNM